MIPTVPIEDFPDYMINPSGQIWSIRKEAFLRSRLNNTGVLNVTMTVDGKQYCRSVAVLVAKAFLESPPSKRMDTIIHFDGDRTNVHMDNLGWRPRPFAIDYHKQFTNQPYRNRINIPLRIEETGEVFPNSYDLAVAYGLLERAVVLTAMNIKGGDRYYTVYPTGFHILFY